MNPMKALYSDGSVKETEDVLPIIRHTASHVLAQAVKRLYPNTKLAIGPSIADGFYYDMEFDTPLTSDDFGKIEAEMKKIIKEDLKIERFTKSREDAIAFMKEKGEPYKVELIEDLPEGEEISFYSQGEFVDLCAGPHLMSTKGVGKAFKIMSLAGAYWRGDEHNKMLTRLYATAFGKKEELEAYITMMEEAKKRDHRKLGKELGLFMMHEAGPGFPFFLPKGMILKNTLLDYWREIHKKAGYVEVSTPIILNRSLWETSGHWDHYKNNMYTTVIDGEDYAIKPMNCPGGVLVYASEPRSYRDLPLRVGELGLVHRHEKSGQLHGLMRVRCFTQDDAHIFMTPDQIKDEIKGVVALINEVYSLFGFEYHVELSTRPEDSMGSDEDWEMATEGLRSALDEIGLPYVVNEGDGAFYGPKIDFHLVDCIGRTWQCGTIQLDFQLPQRFELEYIGADGEIQKQSGVVPVGRALHQRTAVGDTGSAVGRVDQSDVLPGGDMLEGSLLQRDANQGASVSDCGQHRAGAVQLLSIQCSAQPSQAILHPTARLKPGHQRRIGGTGYLGVGKGDFSPKSRGFQILPAR